MLRSCFSAFFHKSALWRLRGLAVACWTTDHYHPCSNTSVGISEGCFAFRFVFLPMEMVSKILDNVESSYIKLRTTLVMSKCSIYKFILDYRKLLLNVNCGVKIVYDMYVASHH